MTKEEKIVIDEFEGEASYSHVMKNPGYFIVETYKFINAGITQKREMNTEKFISSYFYYLCAEYLLHNTTFTPLEHRSLCDCMLG